MDEQEQLRQMINQHSTAADQQKQETNNLLCFADKAEMLEDSEGSWCSVSEQKLEAGEKEEK